MFKNILLAGLILFTPVAMAQDAPKKDMPSNQEILKKNFSKFFCPNQFPGFPTTGQFQVLSDYNNVFKGKHYIYILDKSNNALFELEVQLDKDNNVISRCISGIGNLKIFENPTPTPNVPNQAPEEKNDNNAL